MPITMVQGVAAKPPVQQAMPRLDMQQVKEAGADKMPSFQALDLLPKQPNSEGPLGELASQMLGSVHSRVETMSQNLPSSLKAVARDEVSSAKDAMSPKQEAIKPGEADANGKTDEAVSSLAQSFDHAIFMAMVNQVISGVGDTARTLIRQS